MHASPHVHAFNELGSSDGSPYVHAFNELGSPHGCMHCAWRRSPPSLDGPSAAGFALGVSLCTIAVAVMAGLRKPTPDHVDRTGLLDGTLEGQPLDCTPSADGLSSLCRPQPAVPPAAAVAGAPPPYQSNERSSSTM